MSLDPKVVLSSEWDYSPLTYPMTVSVLPNFVLLGMPASESSNALILPLAGHELGHSVWQSDNMESAFRGEVQDEARNLLKSRWSEFVSVYTEHAHLALTDRELLNNLFLVNVVSDIVGLCISQVEEVFCDAIGVFLFGRSYAHAFHYLLSPGLGGVRSLEYPRLNIRAGFIEQHGGLALNEVGYLEYSSQFVDQQPTLPPRYAFISRAADDLCEALSAGIYKAAENLVATKAGAHIANSARYDEIVAMFNRGVPARLQTHKNIGLIGVL